MNILVVDVGGTNIKIKNPTGPETRKLPSGPQLSARDMVEAVHPVGNPADVVLGRYHFQGGEPLEHAAVHHPRQALFNDVNDVNLQIRGGRHRRRERHPGH